MDRRFTLLAAAAAETHGVFTTSTARYLGISDSLRNKWIEQGKIERVGRHTFCFAGVPKTWHMMLAEHTHLAPNVNAMSSGAPSSPCSANG